ncbi:hypothetical protein [Collinsella sp. UBA1693]|uniref:hypothetical protein n=1 Tax=Collinsella sp. UBA1693 TaxID=1946385 RepID=UPI00257C4E79|nr:hypothetical protein [Collinsella sp. UBA1693]
MRVAMSTAMLIEVLEGVSELLRQSVEADYDLTVGMRAAMHCACEECIEELRARWEEE